MAHWRGVIASIVILPALAFGESSVPRFADHRVEIYGGAKAPLQMRRGTKEWKYRTVISEGYRNGSVDFAGHYVVVTWGCGTSCLMWAFVDALNGAVYMLDFASTGADYRADSALIIANPPSNPEDCVGMEGSFFDALCRGDYAQYYRWNGGKLERLYSAWAHRQIARTPSSKRAPTPMSK
jgi:hypothetical protein